MGFPNNNCGECAYWLAYREPETADEQNLAIEAHCAKCELDFDFVAAEEAHDNTIRSSVESSSEIREAKELLTRSLEMLYLLGYDSGFTNSDIGTLTGDIKKFLRETE